MAVGTFEKTEFEKFAAGREIARIENGPDAEDLAHALITKGETVGFELRGFGVIRMGVTLLQAEDGSKESWNIAGYAEGENYRLYYRTDTRKGVWHFKKK